MDRPADRDLPERDHAFSRRLLNPFSGTLQVFVRPEARALSSDGIDWELQVATAAPSGLWANTPRLARRYFRFGCWNHEQGLRQVPLNPILDTRAMMTEAEALVAALARRVERLPFAPAACLELWAFDRDGLPLALLAEQAPTHPPLATPSSRWRAYRRGDSRLGVDRTEALARLERRVGQRSGGTARCRWLRREADGSGQPIASTDGADPPGERIPAAAFPQLPLAVERLERDAAIEVYLDWLAPRLLTLATLDDQWRAALEQRALRQPAEIARLWRLLPRVIDRERLNAARVAATIEHSNRHA